MYVCVYFPYVFYSIPLLSLNEFVSDVLRENIEFLHMNLITSLSELFARN